MTLQRSDYNVIIYHNLMRLQLISWNLNKNSQNLESAKTIFLKQFNFNYKTKSETNLTKICI